MSRLRANVFQVVRFLANVFDEIESEQIEHKRLVRPWLNQVRLAVRGRPRELKGQPANSERDDEILISLRLLREIDQTIDSMGFVYRCFYGMRIETAKEWRRRSNAHCS